MAQYENAFAFFADELNPGYHYTINSNASHNLLVFGWQDRFMLADFNNQ